MVTDRAPTSINGLDDMIEGGFPRGSVVFNSESAPTTFRVSNVRKRMKRMTLMQGKILIRRELKGSTSLL